MIFYYEYILRFVLNTLILEIKNACVCDYTYHAICLKVCGCLGSTVRNCVYKYSYNIYEAYMSPFIIIYFVYYIYCVCVP